MSLATSPGRSPQSGIGAARFVGRIGGLAAALGIGAVMVSGVAWADTTPDADTGRATEAHVARSAASPRPGTPAGRTGPAATRVVAPTEGQTRPAAAVSVSVAAAAPDVAGDAAAPAPVAAAGASAVGGSVNQISVDPAIAWGGTFRRKDYPGVLVGTLNAFSPLPLTYTTISTPSLGGKLGAKANTTPSNTDFGQQGEFFYIPSVTALTDPTKTESFQILVAQQTGFDDLLKGLPVIGLFMPALLVGLHRAPILGGLLSPLIGAATVVTFAVKPYELATDPNDPARQRPTAFTTRVESFDGLLVSVNYFPAVNVAEGRADSAPTVLNGPGLGAPGNTDVSNPYAQLSLFPWVEPPTPRRDQFGSLTPGLPVLREDRWISPDSTTSYDGGGGYNVITWDPRGEWATRDRSLPGLQVDNPFFEGRDASAIISWAGSAANPVWTQVAMESPGDPLIGMVGGSYGGGIQWVTAATDPRVDAIAPEISWNSLISALYPNTNQFKTGWGTVLLLALVATGANINTLIYQGIGTGVTVGRLTQTAQALLSSAGPTVLLNEVQVPALIFQGMEDGLFPLAESVANARALVDNGFDQPVKLVWFCGGHGTCLDPLNSAQDDRGLVDNLRWLDQYVAGNGTPGEDVPVFQWYDQRGDYHFSPKLPFQAGFNRPEPYTTTGAGGLLGIVPVLGGSGPGDVDGVSPILTLGNGTPARNALNLIVTPPNDAQVVGAPTLSFSYRGIGTSRTVYAQLIDNATGRVLGNIVTPIPVSLDGGQHSLTIPMADIAYTAAPRGDSITLQIIGSASNFQNLTSFGVINISDVRLDLPIRAV